MFSDGSNPDRKQPFDIRSVMRAVIDSDHQPLERWAAMRDAEVAVVWDAHLGGWPVSLIGIESRPLPRRGTIPADGPEQWTAGTLFPRAAKKIARALNAAAGRRPMVVLANLAGFDGSPESLREWQLEFGAEIARAVVNFDGPIVFCVLSRYHGGAFVVFSQRLNPNLETVALEGARASVIGGRPRGGGRVRRRGRAGRGGRRANPVARRGDRAGRGRRAPAPAGSASERCGSRCWPRSGERLPSASTGFTASSERLRWDRSRAVIEADVAAGLPDRGRRAGDPPRRGLRSRWPRPSPSSWTSTPP